MSDTNHCESCSMTIDDGTYCQHCTDDNGGLRPFDELYERMVQWTLRQEGAGSREEAERKTLGHMATMPAWRDHPQVRAALKAGAR